ncbi:MAG: CHAP domain-containing protein [Nocardioides sp.]|uniref:CHAP domain-containing protein n=1 Tax=Nocardioides sp. TaxID=35761 RepID=UPI003F068A31
MSKAAAVSRRLVHGVVLAMVAGLIAFLGSTPAHAAAKTVDEFVAAYNGRYVDVDGFPAEQPYQCTDLFNKFHSEVMGGSYVRMDISGGAKDLWSTSNAQIANLYTKVSASATARKGDVAVWSGNMAGSGGYGHVAIVLTDKGSALSTLTQNPGATTIKDIGKTHLLGYLRPKSLPGGGSTVSDGSFVSNGGRVYRIAGGAPIYVTTWNIYGGAQPTTPLSDAQFAALRPHPADGTFVRGVQRGEIYRFAGGAPTYVSTNFWATLSPKPAWVDVDQASLDNPTITVGNRVRSVPADGTFVVSHERGEIYRVAGGAPVYVTPSFWASISSKPNPVRISQEAVDRAGGTGAWSHLRAVPADGTFLSSHARGEIYRVAGGAPLYVTPSYWNTLATKPAVTSVSQEAVDSAGGTGAWSHLRAVPADGTVLRPHDRAQAFTVTGGIARPSFATGGITVDGITIDNAGRGAPWHHLASSRPVATLHALPRALRKSRLSVTWPALVTSSRTVGYDVRWRHAGRRWTRPKDWQGISATQVTMRGIARKARVCLSVRAHNLAGMTGPWSASRCVRRR